MLKLVLALAVLLLLSLLIWVLYRNGYLVIQNKTAVSFAGSFRGTRASFSGCTGTLRRIVNLDAGEHRFELAVELKKGEFSIELWNEQATSLLTLTQDAPTAVITLGQAARCTMVVSFEKATGKYAVAWE